MGAIESERKSASSEAGAGAERYGLHAGVLGPVETLAQSVSAMAPSTSASLTIPLVFALAGNATWFVYLLALAATLMVGFSINRFARLSASPGSLYSYASEGLPAVFGDAAGWGLLLAYLGTGASVAGGALYYAGVFGSSFLHWSPNGAAVLAGVCVVAALVGFRDVKLSAELMLWIEVASLGSVLVVLALILFHGGWHIDLDQLRLSGVHTGALGPALVLAMFSFVGFESATTLGAEARDPLKTIPRAVLQCAVLAGVLFMLCAYSEVLGFRGETTSLSDSTSPLHMLAGKAGVEPVGIAIDLGAAISMVACVLACITAAARVLMRMAHQGVIPKAFERTHPRYGTPTAGIAVSAALMLAGTLALLARGVNGSEMYDLAGSMAVFGFLTSYALVAAALPFARKAAGHSHRGIAVLSVATVGVMILIAVYDLRSAADVSHARIPWMYLVYLAAGLGWNQLRRRLRG